jgi:hypothetical protein
MASTNPNMQSSGAPPGVGQAPWGAPAAKIKASTHAVAVTLGSWIAAAAVFVATPAGAALVKQYPKLAAAAGALTAAAAAMAAYKQPS